MTKEQGTTAKTSYLKKAKRELSKSLFFFMAGSFATAAWMFNNRRKQKLRKKLEKELENQEENTE